MMIFNSIGNWNIPFCKKQDRFAKAYITKPCNQIKNVSNVIKPIPAWEFMNCQFDIPNRLAKPYYLIYCDPLYFGRYLNYYNGGTEKDEELLFTLLNETKSKFILSTWHHNDYRKNEVIDKY